MEKVKILIFGTGSVAEVLYNEIDLEKAQIVGFINSNYKVQKFHEYQVILPEHIKNYIYDYVVIGSGYFLQIEKLLLEMGIAEDKIVGFIYDEEESYQDITHAISVYLNERYHRDIIKKILKSDKLYPELSACVVWKNECLKKVRKDFVREQSLRLLADEIVRKKLNGAVAELGVFRGDFTVVINQVFPDRVFYLFDTFCGFAEEDVRKDTKVNNKENELLKFQDTSEELVLSRLGDGKVRCVVKKGFFPNTFDLPDERFCFVSIDMNMYEPVQKALEIFWPRMVKGGYVLISDYNAPFYDGTRKAILDFCEKNDVLFLPIPDLYGSAVICKGSE